MSRPRIYITVATFHPIVGGIERQALIQAMNLRERGHEVTILTFRHNKAWRQRETIEGVPVIRVAGAFLGDREQLPGVIQRFLYLMALVTMGWILWRLRQSYDILHVHQLALLALPTAMVCKMTGKPMIIVVHSAGLGKSTGTHKKASLVAGPLDPATQCLQIDALNKVNGDLTNLERLGKPIVQFTRSLLQSINAEVFIISSRMKSYLEEHDFTLPNIHLIPNGVDITRFHPIPIDTLHDERTHVVICISRLSYEKGIDVLLQAWYLVQKQFPEARLIIVGNGPLQEQFECMTQALNIAESVEFAGLQSDIPAQLHRGALAVLPSRWEGMPVAVLEAMACGIPCVATRVSGSEDIITHGDNGLLVEPEDYQSMAQALLALLRDPELTQKYGLAARATIEQHYSLERITDMYLELYQQMADRKRQLTEDIPSPAIYHSPL